MKGVAVLAAAEGVLLLIGGRVGKPRVGDAVAGMGVLWACVCRACRVAAWMVVIASSVAAGSGLFDATGRLHAARPSNIRLARRVSLKVERSIISSS